MMTLFAIVLVGLGTYASRAVFILAFANRTIPASVQRTLQYVAPATLSALIITMFVDQQGALTIGAAESAGLITGAATAYFTRNHTYTLLVGMGVFLLFGHFL